jgi:hypothetical protein
MLTPKPPPPNPSPAETAIGDTCVELFHEKKAGTEKAGGFLFVDEESSQEGGLIRSILDLTRELAKLGVIEVYPQPNGAEYYRIVRKTPPSRVPKQPKGELKTRLGAIFKRRPTTLWGTEEIKAFAALVIDPEDLQVVEEYYKSEAKKEDSYCRTSLLTLLRHWSGEVDKARRWKETSARRHSY